MPQTKGSSARLDLQSKTAFSWLFTFAAHDLAQDRVRIVLIAVLIFHPAAQRGGRSPIVQEDTNACARAGALAGIAAGLFAAGSARRPSLGPRRRADPARDGQV
eukprot:3097629-Pleurochrysis_carterae.AAC.1